MAHLKTPSSIIPGVVTPFSSGDMAASITSPVIDGRYYQQLKIFIGWVGAPVGTLSLQECPNYTAAKGPQASDRWYDDGAGIIGPAGADGSVIINLSNRAPSWYRVVYTRTSGTGTLTLDFSGAGYQ